MQSDSHLVNGCEDVIVGEATIERLYTDEYARWSLRFRRLRSPRVIGVSWNHIFINNSMREIMRYFVRMETGYR